MTQWGDLFSQRQLLMLATLSRLTREIARKYEKKDAIFAEAVQVCMAITLSRGTDLNNSLCRWKQDAECPVNLFGRQAIPMVWDFAETVITSGSSGSWPIMFQRTYDSILPFLEIRNSGNSILTTATKQTLPDDVASLLATDPPYYDAIPYSHLSDFFYVFLKRILYESCPGLFSSKLVEKTEEIVVDRAHSLSTSNKGIPDENEGKVSSSSKQAVFAPGATVLDRVHQCMLLFAAGRSDALKRFLVDEDHGKDAKLWKLAQSLSALYPTGSNEKRWVDGVLARKKGLGF